jgi:hypothetical protein
MDFGWGLDGYAARYSISDLTNTNVSMAHGVTLQIVQSMTPSNTTVLT